MQPFSVRAIPLHLQVRLQMQRRGEFWNKSMVILCLNTNYKLGYPKHSSSSTNSSPSNMSVSPLILLHHADFYDYGSHTGGCKFSFKLIKSIQLALHQSDFTAKSVWPIFSHSAWGLAFHWLCPCILNTCKKDSSWKTVRRKYVFLFQLRRSLWGFFR